MTRVPGFAVKTLATAALLVAGAAWGQAPGPAAPAAAPPLTGRSLEPPGGVLVAPGSAPDLIFLTTGDVIGYLEPCG
jgi:hypothetical protein